jgi:tetratricopeptide (TPR) repeat protein
VSRRGLLANKPARRPLRARLRASGRPGRRRAATPRTSSSAATQVAGEQRAHARYVTAVKNFEAGVRLFQKQNYERAKEVFEKLACGPAYEVANRAETYLRLCEQKLGRKEAAPKTAADYYDVGVAQLNARDLERAIGSLNRADRLGPNQDHVRYALAAAHALLHNVDAALEHLKAAIGLRPANRFLARKDEDFRGLAADPRFRRLVHPEVY